MFSKITKINFFSILILSANLCASDGWNNDSSSFFEDHKTAIVATASFVGGITVAKVAAWYSSYRNANSVVTMIGEKRNQLERFKRDNSSLLESVIHIFTNAKPTELIDFINRCQAMNTIVFDIDTQTMDKKARSLNKQKNSKIIDNINQLKIDIDQVRNLVCAYNNIISAMKEYASLRVLQQVQITTNQTLSSILFQDCDLVYNWALEDKLNYICENSNLADLARNIKTQISSINSTRENLLRHLNTLAKIKNQSFDDDVRRLLESLGRQLQELQMGHRMFSENESYLNLYSLCKMVKVEFQQEIEVIATENVTQDDLNNFNVTIEHKKTYQNKYPFANYRNNINTQREQIECLISKINNNTKLSNEADEIRRKLYTIAESIDKNSLKSEESAMVTERMQEENTRILEQQHRERIEQQRTEQDRLKRDTRVAMLECDKSRLERQIVLLQRNKSEESDSRYKTMERDNEKLRSELSCLKLDNSTLRGKTTRLEQRVHELEDKLELQVQIFQC